MKITIKIVLKTAMKNVLKTAMKNVLKNYVRNKKEMSFLKISDPVKRDLIVIEYLELKKNIRDNLLSERTGEQELQTDLSKFYRPITETQKATAREIMEELKPIKEGIEKLPQAITFPPMQPLGEASGKAPKEETPEDLGDIAYHYLHTNAPYPRDEAFGIYQGEEGYYHMGKQGNKVNEKRLTIAYNNIYVDGEKIRGTPGLWHLIMEKNPSKYTKDDLDNYKRLVTKANVLNRNFEPNSSYPKKQQLSKMEKYT